MSHIQQQRDAFKANRIEVMNLLKWDELQYGEFQYERGLQYLKHGLTMEAYWVEALERQELFWKWWVNEWNLRDQRTFLPNAKHHLNPYAFYSRIHGYAYINTHPAKEAMETAYAKMIGDLFDAQKQEFVNQDKAQTV